MAEIGETARQAPWNKGRRKLDARRKAIFIATLRDTASAMKAAEAAGVCVDTAYAARKEDVEFRAQWQEAVDVALDQLLGEAFRRAVQGVAEPVVQGGRWVEYEDEDGETKRLTITKYSDRMLEVLMRLRFGQELSQRVTVTTEGPLGLEPEVLMRMAPEDRRFLLELLRNYAALVQPEAAGHLPTRAALPQGS